MNSRRIALLYLAGVFVAGALTGGFAGFALGRRPFFRPPEPQSLAAHIMAGLKRDLALSEEQGTKVRPFVEEAVTEAEAIHAKTFDRMHGVMTNMNRRIGEFLTPEQRAKLAECDRQRQARFRHPPGGPAPKQP